MPAPKVNILDLTVENISRLTSALKLNEILKDAAF
jgi:hypothetical protein